MKSFLNFIIGLFSKKDKGQNNESSVTNVVEKDKEKTKEKPVVEEKIDWALKITVKRKFFNEHDTIGDLYVSYPEEPNVLNFVCNTLEDKVRNPKGTKKEDFVKVYGETAIPYGTYRVVITYSNAFKKKLPEILNVPLYEGIRIHNGNTNLDSLGCVLLGDSPKISQTESWVYNSKKNMNKFMSILEPAIKKGRVIIEITD